MRELYEDYFHKTPGSKEAREYGLTRGTCFVASRLEVVAVAGLLWISCCVLGGADIFVRACVCVCVCVFFERTRPAASMKPPCLIYLFNSTLFYYIRLRFFCVNRSVPIYWSTTVLRTTVRLHSMPCACPRGNRIYTRTSTSTYLSIIQGSGGAAYRRPRPR